MSIFTPTEKRDLIHALSMWINYVQTGDVSMSQVDAVNAKMEDKIKPITEEQMERILELKKLQRKVTSL